MPENVKEQENQESNSQKKNISGEACTLVNIQEIQSLNIKGTFSKESSSNGWMIIVNQDCEATVNYKSSMRKTDISMSSGDIIEKDGDTLFFIKQQPIESYKQSMSASPISMDLQTIRSARSKVSVDGKTTPVPAPPQES